MLTDDIFRLINATFLKKKDWTNLSKLEYKFWITVKKNLLFVDIFFF